ncbi:MAG TPA: 50S ribosomal protein L24 [Candidatus Goldiibacteriota bacterium]|nr:50S ribosomal protein L24 [Candidatus Goldiibacteriota bacterium]HPI03240.1 50S ribosomal protein L24 [Candidatus Goldiibacteriota bacterium]HPN65535.1 50S ribosomal protein L24 [Candidatus Goldiibacteriota bacterium]HRQ42964.1 50S ribosomal protein L24 [Candidatus Goldiibacteriota bacterium]
MKVKIKKNDIVTVIKGKDKGKSGKVLKMFADDRRIVVEKINFVKRHTKPSQKVQQGGIIEKEAAIRIDNVMLICNKCGKPTRVKVGMIADNKKVRICKKCNEMLDEK